MAVLAVSDCLEEVPRQDWNKIPVILCVAEQGRPGREPRIDDDLLVEIQAELGVSFAGDSLIVARGRVSASLALMHARQILADSRATYVLIVATDSLLSRQTLTALENDRRLLRADNSNGFIPGEGAAAVLVRHAVDRKGFVCTGLGFATELATVSSTLPLRADGLSKAITSAILDASCSPQDLDFRITDLAGEQYYFKEAALASSRSIRTRRQEFAIWHPAESVGELGAASGLAGMVLANDAAHRGYAPGPNVLCHAGADTGERAAVVFQFGAS